MASVLATIYLIFNEGYFATSGGVPLRVDLADSAIRLGRLLREWIDDPEAGGLLALMLLQNSRRAARIDEGGDLVLLQDQDRSLWDPAAIAEGLGLLAGFSDDSAGPYQLQAAIAGEHARAVSWEETDWRRIVGIYDSLSSLTGSPVVRLNRAVAIAQLQGPEAGLQAMGGLDLEGYHGLHTARGEMFSRLGRLEEARAEWELAAGLAKNKAERRLLRRRLAGLAEAHAKP